MWLIGGYDFFVFPYCDLFCCSEQVIAGLDQAVATMMKKEFLQSRLNLRMDLGMILWRWLRPMFLHIHLYEVELVDFTNKGDDEAVSVQIVKCRLRYLKLQRRRE